jgi:hypothetical protein
MQVEQACERHADDIERLVLELYPTGQEYALEVEPEYRQHVMQAHRTHSIQDVLRGVFEYSQSVAAAVPSVDMAAKEFYWRNGFFVWRRRTQMHLDMLARAGFAQNFGSVDNLS